VIYVLRTGYKSCTLRVPVLSRQLSTVIVQVKDYDRPETIITRRIGTFSPGEKGDMLLQMPLTGENIIVEVFENEFDIAAAPMDFAIGNLRLDGLHTSLDVARMNDPYINEWLLFRGQFAFNARWLPSNKSDQVYQSSQKNFQIKLEDILYDEKGNEDVTPMYRNPYSAIIFVSKKKIYQLDLTVNEIISISDHEYSHMNRNKVKADEVEADLNGTTISFCSGIPEHDIREAYYKCLYNVDSGENEMRLYFLDDYLGKIRSLTA
jgi:hypothetical protein